jgi:hypothetical protein
MCKQVLLNCTRIYYLICGLDKTATMYVMIAYSVISGRYIEWRYAESATILQYGYGSSNFVSVLPEY